MISKEVWSCILTHVESPGDFHNISLISKTTAAASKNVKHTVANCFSRLDFRLFGWTHFFAPTKRHLLHGTRGTIDDVHGNFNVKTFSFGRIKGKCYEVRPYSEPGHLSTDIIEHMRDIYDVWLEHGWKFNEHIINE